MASDFSRAVQQFSDEINKRVSRISGTNRVSFAELFTPEFMRQHTKVESFDKLFELGGFTVNSEQDFVAIPDAAWETVIVTHTSFGSWLEMQQAAGTEWMAREFAR